MLACYFAVDLMAAAMVLQPLRGAGRAVQGNGVPRFWGVPQLMLHLGGLAFRV